MDYHGSVIEYSLIIYYLAFVNLISFFLIVVDKYKAKKNKWRIPEKTLMILAIIGGSLGSLIGMYVMRHKTHKKKFTMGIPIILVLQVVLIWYFIH